MLLQPVTGTLPGVQERSVSWPHGTFEGTTQHGCGLKMKQDVVTVEGEGAASHALRVLLDQLRGEWAYQLTILSTGSKAGRVLYKTALWPVPADLGEFDEAGCFAVRVDDDVAGVEISAGQRRLSLAQITPDIVQVRCQHSPGGIGSTAVGEDSGQILSHFYPGPGSGFDRVSGSGGG
jgi:hypothetical protein